MSHRILIVEDDRFLAGALERLLAGQGFTPVLAHTAGEGARSAKDSPPDLILLDLNLPDEDGVHLCRRLRQFLTAPILMLTSRTDAIDKVLGLESGADDYLTKPFESHELVARVRAHLRRATQYAVSQSVGPKHLRQVGNVTLDLGSRTASVADEELSLTETEFQILDYLMANCQRALSREQIFEKVWGYDIEFSSNTLEVLVYRLRQKLSRARATCQITTLRGFGYRFEGE